MKSSSDTAKRRVLVINPPAVVARDFIDYPYFANLGVLQHAAVIANAGYETVVADAFAQPGSGATPIAGGGFFVGCEVETLLEIARVAKFDAVVVCVSVFHQPFARNESLAHLFAGLRKINKTAPIAAVDAYYGGMHYIDYSGSDFLNNYPEVDALLRYETDCAVLDWLDTANEQKETGVEISSDPPRDLDELPFPAWNLIDIDSYFSFIDKFMAQMGRVADFSDIMPVLPVVTSRGCLYNCAFCSGTAIPERGKYRRISVGKLREYLTELAERYSIRGIAVLDGLANGTEAAFEELLDAVGDAGLKVCFLNGLRADRLKKRHIKKLADIALSLTVSAESAAENIRNGVLNKRLDLGAIEKVAAWCREYGLQLYIHYMVGVPGESVADMNRTLDHAHAMLVDLGARPLVQRCVPIPGSSLHAGLSEVKKITGDYSTLFAGGEADVAGRMIDYFKTRSKDADPEKLIINLTYKCNNKCGMCAVGGRPRRHMEYERCISLLSEYRDRGVRMLDLDGGEPTLHPDLLRIIGEARGMGYESVNVTTNGRKLDSRGFASRLLLSGITDLHISIYGQDAENHERVTGVKGSFEQTLGGIKHVLRLKPDRVNICVNTVLLKDNYGEIGSLMKWLAGLGVEALDVQFPTPFGTAKKEHLPPLDEAVAEFRRAAREHGDSLSLNLINLQPCMMPPGWPAAASDAGKYGRHMAFVNEPPMSLGAFLATRRRREAECLDCEYHIICEGFYIFD